MSQPRFLNYRLVRSLICVVLSCYICVTCWSSNRRQIHHPRRMEQSQPLPKPQGLTREGSSPPNQVLFSESRKGAWTRLTTASNLKVDSPLPGSLALWTSGSDPRFRQCPYDKVAVAFSLLLALLSKVWTPTTQVCRKLV